MASSIGVSQSPKRLWFAHQLSIPSAIQVGAAPEPPDPVSMFTQPLPLYPCGRHMTLPMKKSAASHSGAATTHHTVT